MEEKGFTLIELMVVLSVIALISMTAFANIKVLDNPLHNAVSSNLIFLQLARAKAISKTRYCKVYPSFNKQIVVAFGSSCETATDVDSSTKYDFPTGTSLSNTDWSICFTPRGFSHTNISFDITNQTAQTSTIEVSLGGGAKEV